MTHGVVYESLLGECIVTGIGFDADEVVPLLGRRWDQSPPGAGGCRRGTQRSRRSSPARSPARPAAAQFATFDVTDTPSSEVSGTMSGRTAVTSSATRAPRTSASRAATRRIALRCRSRLPTLHQNPLDQQRPAIFRAPPSGMCHESLVLIEPQPACTRRRPWCRAGGQPTVLRESCLFLPRFSHLPGSGRSSRHLEPRAGRNLR
jgi:hypothetical protein